MRQKKRTHVTLQDVAQHAGVSRATASLAVRGSDTITEITRDKVLNSMRELGYVYDRVAANLRSNTPSSTIGLIIMELANPFYSELLVGIHDELNKSGQTVILGTTFDSKDIQERLLSTMMEHRVGGIILSAVPGTSLAAIDKVRQWGIPLVLVGRKIAAAPYDFVGIDNALGAQMAVEHLLRKGHRRIAFLGGFSSFSSWQGRKQGYDTALRQAGIELDDALVIEGQATRKCGFDLLQRLLSVPNPPTAVFCYNDVMAIGAMMKMSELGVIPGKDMAVVGFDDVPEASIFTPKLTTISSSIRELGMEAAQVLRRRIEGLDSEPENIILQPKLIVRESCSYTRTGSLHL